jgi:hypothetical protein
MMPHATVENPVLATHSFKKQGKLDMTKGSATYSSADKIQESKN